SVLGVRPQLGRVFANEEDVYGKHHVVVLTHAFWRREFAGDPATLGRTVQLDGETYTVVGVLPEGLNYPGAQTDFWMPLALAPDELANRNNHTKEVVARLKPGVTLAKVQAELDAIALRSAQEHPENKGHGVTLVSLQDELVGGLRRPLYMLVGAVGLVLLIACTNVASLMLARATARHREFAIRAALGAGRRHLYKQLLSESLLLALAGGLLGSLLAVWALPVLTALAPANLPRLEEVRLNPAIFLFSLVISLGTGVVFGLVPAVLAQRCDVNETLKSGNHGTASSALHNRLRGGLVVVEIAVSMILLIGAGLLLRSFSHVRDVDAGFQAERLLTATVTLPDNKYPDEARMAAFFDQAVQRLRTLPGVDSASAVFGLPLSGFDPGTGITVEGGTPLPSNEPAGAGLHQIATDYFRTMGTPLLRGRVPDAHDTAASARVVVVNESFVRRFFPGQDPIGRRITHGASGGKPVEIIGLVRDVRHQDLATAAHPEIYVPMSQSCWGYASLVMRTRVDPASLAGLVRKSVAELDADLPVDDLKPMTVYVAQTTAQRQFQAILVGSFAAAALILAAVGIYSVIAYWVNQRTREIGVRLALGAQLADVVAMVLREGLALTGAGLGLGLLAALFLTRSMAGLLYQVTPWDPFTYITVAAVLATVGTLASWIPARRATRVDPLTALRNE
ncbi:MAG TPA: ABC transporter permease, partial [Candidatus Limnocylindria bacterium]|nr:ABC transporter permease [Candidatus Limnocylindria bacterium]